MGTIHKEIWSIAQTILQTLQISDITRNISNNITHHQRMPHITHHSKT